MLSELCHNHQVCLEFIAQMLASGTWRPGELYTGILSILIQASN